MTSHLTLPYNWIDCADPESCPQHTHLEDTAYTLNNYPVEWIEELIGNCRIKEEAILHYNNEPHKANGFTIEEADGAKQWFLNGQLHREDGPAIIYPNGTQLWFLNGKRHRDNGPAAEYPDGTGDWYQNGELHRTDGPAVINYDGTEEWWVHGVKQNHTPTTQTIMTEAPAKSKKFNRSMLVFAKIVNMFR